MSVRFLPETRDYLEQLVTVPYRERYFSWLDRSRKYVDELVADILTTRPARHHKPAPRYFDRYGVGMWYAAFRRNRTTTWYIYFTKYDDDGQTVYLVRHIANNHTVAQYL